MYVSRLSVLLLPFFPALYLLISFIDPSLSLLSFSSHPGTAPHPIPLTLPLTPLPTAHDIILLFFFSSVSHIPPSRILRRSYLFGDLMLSPSLVDVRVACNLCVDPARGYLR